MKKILVVDDILENRELLKAMLSPLYEVILANDGTEGLAIAKSNNPDIIITDIQMPNMSGDNFVKELCKDPMTQDIPTIFYTSGEFVADASLMAIRCGVPLVLPKPCEPDVIMEAIKTVSDLGDEQKKLKEPEVIIVASDIDLLRDSINKFTEKYSMLKDEHRQINLVLKIIGKKEQEDKRNLKDE